MEALSDPRIEWGAASRTLAGESESGDRHLVTILPDGAILAAVDGLGHGREAARAAELAVQTVERHAALPLTEIVQSCQRSLVKTRGAALSLARWSAGLRKLSWLGVGNVEGLLLKNGSGGGPARERLLQRVGVVGTRLPPLQESAIDLPQGGVLIFTTDGIAGDIEPLASRRIGPQQMAEEIMARCAKGTDDALVLVARLGA